MLQSTITRKGLCSIGWQTGSGPVSEHLGALCVAYRVVLLLALLHLVERVLLLLEVLLQLCLMTLLDLKGANTQQGTSS